MVIIKKIIRQVLLLGAILLYQFSFNCQAAISPTVRVQVLREMKRVRLDVSGAFSLKIVDNDTVILKKESAGNLLIQGTPYGFDIEGKEARGKRIEISRLDDGPISVNSRLFRGNLRFVKDGVLSFFAVNYVDLEDYIRGVLYHEISHLWPSEAIKAQAVLVRTFALSQMGTSKDKEFDLTNDIYSQMYGGRTSERFRLNNAVDETKNEVITFDAKIFPAYYHATCSGHTEDAKNLWDIDLLPLRGVACPYCKDSPHYKWDTYIGLDELRSKLRSSGFKVGKIKAIEITRHSNSNRILELKIISDSSNLKISGKAFREAVGPNVLRSNNFEVRLERDKAFFEGLGWGHGVGLCQWGAYFMGKEGFNYRQILEFYYPGSKLEKIN